MTNHGNHMKLMVTVVVVFLGLTAFGVPIPSYLPLLAVVILCPLMMVMMMGGMDHSDNAANDDPTTKDETSATSHRQ